LKSEDEQLQTESETCWRRERERERNRGVDCWLPASQEFALKYSAGK